MKSQKQYYILLNEKSKREESKIDSIKHMESEIRKAEKLLDQASGEFEEAKNKVNEMLNEKPDIDKLLNETKAEKDGNGRE